MTNTVLIKRSGTANSVPTAGQLLPGELAINYADGNLFYKNTSNVVTTIASNKFASVSGNVTGGNVNTSGIVSAAGIVYGNELNSTNASGSEGGQINLAAAPSGTLSGSSVTIDIYNNQLRFFEQGGSARGAYIDLSAASAGVGSNLLAGGSSSTPTQIVNGTSNVSVTSSGNITANVAGAWAASFYSAGMIANSFWANNNTTGQNFRVGDDAWIGDVNNADTISIRGQQNAANGYIVFGNADNSTTLGRAGSGPLTYAGAFSATGNITGGNLATAGLITATGNIVGNRIAVAAGTAAAPSVQFSNDVAADTGFYWVSDGNIGVTTNGTLRATFFDTGISIVGNTTSGNVLTGGIISATGNVSGGNINATGAFYIGGTAFTRTLTVGTIGASPVTVPLSSNNSFNVLTIASGNVAVYTT